MQQTLFVVYAGITDLCICKNVTIALEVSMVPMIGESEDVLKIIQLRKLNDAIRQLIMHKVT